jgi:hypothetical protein
VSGFTPSTNSVSGSDAEATSSARSGGGFGRDIIHFPWLQKRNLPSISISVIGMPPALWRVISSGSGSFCARARSRVG